MAITLRQLGAVDRETLAEQRDRQAHPEKYHPKSLGLVEADKLLDGYDPTKYVCVGGKAKSGKTTFTLHTALTLATKRVRIFYVPLEEWARQISIRALSRQSTKVKRSDFRNLRITDEGFDELDQFAREHEELDFTIVEGATTALGLYQALAKLKKEDRPDVVVVDYLQLFQDGGMSMAEKSDRISGIMMQIRNELKIGVLVAFQLGDKGKRQYGGTSVYRDVDTILHLEQKKDKVTGQDMDNILTVTVMPSREVGEGTFELAFSGAHSRVTDQRPQAPKDLLADPNAITHDHVDEDLFVDSKITVEEPIE